MRRKFRITDVQIGKLAECRIQGIHHFGLHNGNQFVLFKSVGFIAGDLLIEDNRIDDSEGEFTIAFDRDFDFRTGRLIENNSERDRCSRTETVFHDLLGVDIVNAL